MKRNVIVCFQLNLRFFVVPMLVLRFSFFCLSTARRMAYCLVVFLGKKTIIFYCYTTIFIPRQESGMVKNKSPLSLRKEAVYKN